MQSWRQLATNEKFEKGTGRRVKDALFSFRQYGSLGGELFSEPQIA
jgi:hypothetical protein